MGQKGIKKAMTVTILLIFLVHLARYRKAEIFYFYPQRTISTVDSIDIKINQAKPKEIKYVNFYHYFL